MTTSGFVWNIMPSGVKGRAGEPRASLSSGPLGAQAPAFPMNPTEDFIILPCPLAVRDLDSTESSLVPEASQAQSRVRAN